MAGRDITIPFGPDKTGGMGFLPPVDDAEADDASLDSDPFAEPPAEKYARPLQEQPPAESADSRRSRRSTDLPVRSRARMASPLDEADESAARGILPEAEPEPEFESGDEEALESGEGDSGRFGARHVGARIIEAFADGRRGEIEDEYQDGALDEDEAVAQGYDEMQLSFMALRDSMGQGRELKAREREMDEFAAQLEADREELADREYILSNYESIVAEQDRIIADHIQTRDARKAELSQLMAKLDETTQELERMRDYHTTEMQPLETELGRVRASADQAKNDERSRKSELSAAENEVRRAGSSEDSVMASAKLEQVRRAYEEAKNRSDRAKESLAEVQGIYDEAREQIERAEGPLERSIEDMKAHAEELKGDVAHLGEEISSSRKRRQYCDAVFQYPHETAKLRAAVESDEHTMREMSAENDELRDQLAASKQQARKAKLALGIVAGIVVVFVIALIIILARG